LSLIYSINCDYKKLPRHSEQKRFVFKPYLRSRKYSQGLNDSGNRLHESMSLVFMIKSVLPVKTEWKN